MKFNKGHIPWNKGKGKPKVSVVCGCGKCRLMTTPGSKYIRGHNMKDPIVAARVAKKNKENGHNERASKRMKGKTYEEIYGKEAKEKLDSRMKLNNPMFNQDIKNKVIETNKSKGNYEMTSKRMTEHNPMDNEKVRLDNLKRMKEHNPMCDKETAIQKVKTQKERGFYDGENLRKKWEDPIWRKKRCEEISEFAGSPERRKLISDLFKGKPKTKEQMEKIIKTNEERGHYEKTSKRMTEKNPMYNHNTVEKVLTTRLENGDIYTVPNQKEIKLWEFLDEKFPDEWEYVGNWSFWIGKKNPDFVHSTKNKVIELFGDYWHKNDDPNVLIQHYRKNGFDCLVIWERELKDMKKVFERVRDFNELK